MPAPPPTRKINNNLLIDDLYLTCDPIEKTYKRLASSTNNVIQLILFLEKLQCISYVLSSAIHSSPISIIKKKLR